MQGDRNGFIRRCSFWVSSREPDGSDIPCRLQSRDIQIKSFHCWRYFCSKYPETGTQREQICASWNPGPPAHKYVFWYWIRSSCNSFETQSAQWMVDCALYFDALALHAFCSPSCSRTGVSRKKIGAAYMVWADVAPCYFWIRIMGSHLFSSKVVMTIQK